MAIVDMYGNMQPVIHDWGKLVEFKINLSNSIYLNNYDLLDNIIIEFFTTYNYKTFTPKGQYVMFHVDFPKESIDVFTNICNSFKGQEWDNILYLFLDSLYIFLSICHLFLK